MYGHGHAQGGRPCAGSISHQTPPPPPPPNPLFHTPSSFPPPPPPANHYNHYNPNPNPNPNHSSFIPPLNPNPNPNPNPNHSSFIPPLNPNRIPYFHNPNPPSSFNSYPSNPNSLLPQIDSAVATVRRNLILAGENVSLFKVSHSVLSNLRLPSWESLGIQLHHVPSLNTLTVSESKINAFIHCYVAAHTITTLFDLEAAICKNECVNSFDDLELGPFLRHPLVIHYFSLSPDFNKLPNVTAHDVVSHLSHFFHAGKRKNFKLDDFLHFIADKYQVNTWDKLGLRIQSLGMYIAFLRQAHASNDLVLDKCTETLKEESTKPKWNRRSFFALEKQQLHDGSNAMETPTEKGTNPSKKRPLFTIQKQELDDRFTAMTQRVNSFASVSKEFCGKHIRFVSSSDEDSDTETNISDSEGISDINVKGNQGQQLCSQKSRSGDKVSSCPYPSVTEEMTRLGLKQECSPSSNHSLKRKKTSEPGKKRRKSKSQTHGEANVERLLSIPGDTKTKKGNNPRSGSDDHLSANDSIRMFITTWKEACREHNASEVFEKILQFHKMSARRQKRLQSLFSSYPLLGLLNIAVSSIKGGMWDSMYDTFQTIRELGTTNAEGNEAYENIDVDPVEKDPSLNKKALKASPCVKVDDIMRKVSEYLAENALLSGDDSLLDIVLMLTEQLCHCEVWLAQQFSVKEFKLLGHGDFFSFLKTHASSIPKELLEFVRNRAQEPRSLEASISREQLAVLVSQASSNLWEDNAVTKDKIFEVLCRQFPIITFKITGTKGVEELLDSVGQHRSSITSSCIVFSSTLMEASCNGNANSFDESNLSNNTGFVTDHGQVVKSLGSVMTKDAVEVLLKAPFLLDLNTWSHWDHVYAPSLGPLPNWLLTEVNAEGLLCVLTRDGKIIRVDSSASPDLLFQAILEESPLEIAVQLLSLLVLSGGKRHASMSLLKCQARQAFEVIMASSSQKYNMGISGDQRSEKKRDLNLGEVSRTSSGIFLCTSLRGMKEDVAPVSRIAIDSLILLPAEFRSFAAEILLAGLQSGIKDVASAVLSQCKGIEERLMLHDIGFSLGIVEWIHDHNSCCPILSLMEPCTKGVEAIEEYPSHEVSAAAANQDELCKTTPSSNHLGSPDVVDSDSGEVVSHYPAGRDIIIDHQQNEAAACFIESIRREEFGLDPSLSDVESSMLKKQHARLGRALNCLSQELYSQDSHFLLELVQNADDNVYPDSVEPTLAFILQHSGVIVLNNERGFTPQNIRALCDVGNSTKKGSSAGYIGQKGIGFKSVFRVTDAPEIHSNGFHIKFDISEGQIGFVLPSVVTPCNTDMYEQLADESDGSKCGRSWNTCIVLPFKSKLIEGSAINNILAMFSDLHPSLLLFLHRLRCIKLRNMLNDSLIVMRKEVLGDGIVKVSHGKDKMTWFVASNKLLPKVFRSNAQMTEISIALTLNETEHGDYEAILKPQPVFSFLPLRSYGLKFILQADFILPSSREEVDGDSPWNQWLLSEFPGLFVNAEKPFCALPCFQQNPGKAVSVYMSFVPLAGEVHGFFSGLPRMIISKLRHSNCLLQDGYPDKWLPPCKLLRGWNEPARSLLSDSLLHDHLGLAFLDKDIYLSDAIARALGVEEYGPRILVQVISSLGHSDNGIKTMGLGWLLSWITELSHMLHSYDPTSRNSGFEQELLLSSLKKVPFIPLSDGTYGSLEEGAIWFNSNYMNAGVNEVGNETFPHLHGTLRVVSHALFSEAAGDIALVNNCTRILQRIGVQQMSAHDLIRNHILPSISDIKSAEKDQQLMTDYVAFIILHLQSNCKDCNVESEQMFSELCNKAIILTNYGYKRPSEVPIHFGREYGSCIDANKFIHGFDHRWHEVDPIYLKHPVTKTCGLQKWREFLQKLGVTDFVKVVMVEKSVADVSSTVLNQMMCDGNYVSSGWVVKDWESPELFDILSLLSMDGSRDRCRYLLEILDSLWDDHLSDKVFGCCSSISDSRNILFKSSFMQCISEIKWIPSGIDSKLHYPTQLFYDCDAVRFLLGSQAAYAVPKIKSSKLVSEIGFKTQVTLDDALCSLQSWQRSESPFTASLLQMSRLYGFIWKELTRSRQRVGDALESGPFIFVPYDSLNTQEDVGGVFLSPGEVYWKDPTGALDCHTDKSISVEEINGVVNKTLCTIYPGLHDFFVKECGVNEYPPLRHYLRILQELSRNALPSTAANIVFQVFLRWSDGLKNGALTCDDMSYLKECLLQSEFTVLPAMQDKWVSLHSSFGLICWCDDEMLKKEFKYSDNIEFLYFGELSDHEKEMLHSKVSVFLQNIGIPAISKIVSREAIYHGSVDCGFKTSMVGWVLPFAQRYIYNLHPLKYDQFKLSGSSNLHLLSIVVVEKLFYRNIIKEQNCTSKKRTQCSSLLQGNMLYTSQESDSHSMFMELSRLFFDGTPELHLANFLQMITTMAESGSTRDQIEFFILNSQKMVKLPDDEPVWTIPSSGAFPDNNDKMSLNALKTQATEQITCVKSSKNVGCSSWPPVGWKTAPGFNHCSGENKFMTQPGATDSATTNLGEIDKHSDEATFTEITEDSLVKMKIQPEGICEQTQPSMDDLPDAGNVVVESISPEEGQSKSNGREEIPGAKQAMVAGRWGEVVAFRYLSGKYGGEMVNWVNQDQETGLPYDIVVGEEEERMHYFEVKASRYAKKDWFVISTREWQFAVDKGDSFSIAHVILNGQDLARITIYKNPVKLCQLGKLQLAVTTPKLYRQPQHNNVHAQHHF